MAEDKNDKNSNSNPPKKTAGADLEPGYYNVTMTGKDGVGTKDEERVYHNSTAKVLQDRGYLKVGKKIEKYKQAGTRE